MKARAGAVVAILISVCGSTAHSEPLTPARADGTYVDGGNVIVVRMIEPTKSEVVFTLTYDKSHPNGITTENVSKNFGLASVVGSVATFTTPQPDACSITLQFLPDALLSVTQNTDADACMFEGGQSVTGTYYRRDASTPELPLVRGVPASLPSAAPPRADPPALEASIAAAKVHVLAAQATTLQVQSQVEARVGRKTTVQADAAKAQQELAKHADAAVAAWKQFITRAAVLPVTSASNAALATSESELVAAVAAGDAATQALAESRALTEALAALVARADDASTTATHEASSARQTLVALKTADERANPPVAVPKSASTDVDDARRTASAVHDEAVKVRALSGIASLAALSTLRTSIERSQNTVRKRFEGAKSTLGEVRIATVAGPPKGPCDIRRADWAKMFGWINPQGGDVTTVQSYEYDDLDGDGVPEAIVHIQVEGDPQIAAAIHRFTSSAYTTVLKVDAKCVARAIGGADSGSGKVVGRAYVADYPEPTEYRVVDGKFVQTKPPMPGVH